MQCFNRVVIPTLYQKDVDPATYHCTPCTKKSRPTVVDAETKARELVEENGLQWLGLQPNPDVFSNKSAYKLAQANTPSFFKLSQPVASEITLDLHAKRIHDAPALVDQVFSRVRAGTVELGTCTLCFESMPHSKLIPSCGRKGCDQRLDDTCLKEWYGANQPGHLLSPMRLTCPFCRRAPSARTLAKFNPQAAALGGLREALDDHGHYFAWCQDCGFAKPALERACCDGDRLPNIRDFVCEECQESRRERAAAVGASPTAAAAERITPCPRCKVPVEKTFGCNHITCVCGAHFCHVCGIEESEEGIYDHMTSTHGGIYDWDDDDE